MPIRRITGRASCELYNSAGTIAEGDSVQYNESNEVVVGATNKGILGVAMQAATSSTTVLIDLVEPGSIWEIPVSTGTMAASYIGQQVDLEDENSISLSASTNNDVTIVGWDGVSTNKAYVRFNKMVLAGAVAE